MNNAEKYQDEVMHSALTWRFASLPANEYLSIFFNWHKWVDIFWKKNTIFRGYLAILTKAWCLKCVVCTDVLLNSWTLFREESTIYNIRYSRWPKNHIQMDMVLVTFGYTCRGPTDLVPWNLSTDHILYPVSYISYPKHSHCLPSIKCGYWIWYPRLWIEP